MSDRTGQTCQTGPTGQTGPTRQTDRTRQDRTGPDMTGQDRTGQDRQSGLHGPLPHLVSFVRPSDSSSSSSSSPHWFIGLSFLPVALVHRLVLFARCKSNCPVLSSSSSVSFFFCLVLLLRARCRSQNSVRFQHETHTAFRYLGRPIQPETEID